MANILIVDDEPEIRKFLRRIITKMGHEVFEAGNGKEAIEIYNNNEIALSLVDINMPEMDGIEYLETVKKIKSEAIVIIMTGFPSADTILKTIEDDGYTYITKPFQVDQIQDLVERGMQAIQSL